MKKVLLAGSLLSILLVGCNNKTGESLNSELVDIGNLGEGYDLIRDTNTGCVYIYERKASYARPLTPYYNEEGNVAGCGEKELDKTKYE